MTLRAGVSVKHRRFLKTGVLLSLVPCLPGEGRVWVVDTGEEWVSHWREEDLEAIS